MYADLDKCPKCNEPRYKDSNGKIPHKRFNHLPLALRLRRLFGHKTTSQLLQQHSECRETTPASLSSIHESIAWNEWFGPEGIFQGQQQGLAFGICLDGVNPYSKEHTGYSMWPIVLFPLNLPESMRRSSSSMMLAGIIPGPGEPRDFHPYLGIVVDDVMSLNKLKIYDAHCNATFKVNTNFCVYMCLIILGIIRFFIAKVIITTYHFLFMHK